MDFFLWQNLQPSIDIRLVTGQTAINQIKKLKIFNLVEDKTLKITTASGHTFCRTYVGTGHQSEKVFAWSTNIQAMRLTNQLKKAAAKEIGLWAQRAVRL